VPAEIPVGIQPESGIDLGDEGGVVGGVEGGIPGGVLGGVLGGMVTEVPPPPPPPMKPKRVGGELQAPALIRRVEPDYPGVAVAAKVSGTVILEATVNETGAVTDVTVLRSIILLDQAAIKAVKQWRYEPLTLNGQPVPFILVVTVTFSLR
jgi:protein TonB